MSAPWSKPLDIDRLADGRTDVDFAVPLAELPKLRAQFASVAGSVDGRVRFEREVGVPVAELKMSGIARLTCQRCLDAMDVVVDRTVRVGLIKAEADVGRVPEDLEPMLAPEGRISVGQLVEEELLLALPIVPLHDDSAACGVASSPPSADEQEPLTTQKPFERLNELLKRK